MYVRLILLLLFISSFSVAKADTSIEKLECAIERVSVDDNTVTNDTIFFDLELNEIELDESLIGTETVQNQLAPSYETTYSKIASGRSNTVELKTTLADRVFAISSINPNPGDVIKNSFVTKNGDFQFHIICTIEL